jgi:ABC-type transport system substrate-binding protein
VKLVLDSAARWSSGEPVTAFDVGRAAALRADPSSLHYSTAWSEALAGVAFASDREAQFTLRNTIERPEELLAVPLRPWHAPASGPLTSATGPYEPVEERHDEARYVLRAGYFALSAGQPSEVVERRFAPVSSALGPLASGELAVVDRIPPWELPKFQRQESLVVEPYAQPTMHLIVPAARNRLLADPVARRALLLALDRPRIAREMAGEAGPNVVQPIWGLSAPRTGDTLVPSDYDPQQLLTAIAWSPAAPAAGGTQRPGWVLAHPPTEVARRACRLIQAQLDLAGNGPAIELRELADSPAVDWDLLYVEWPMVDPRADLERLVGPRGLTPAGPLVAAELAAVWKAESVEDTA